MPRLGHRFRSARARFAFRCPKDLLTEIERVHEALLADWPTMTLTDVLVGLLHSGIRACEEAC